MTLYNKKVRASRYYLKIFALNISSILGMLNYGFNKI